MRSIVAAIIVRNRQRTLYTVYAGDDRIHSRSFGADRFLGSRSVRVTGSGGEGSLFVFRLAGQLQPSVATSANLLSFGCSWNAGSDAKNRSSATMILSSALDTLRHFTAGSSTGHMMYDDAVPFHAVTCGTYAPVRRSTAQDEAEEIAAKYLNGYQKSSSAAAPGASKLEDYQSSRKDLCCELLPTPPRSPDRSDSSSSGSDGEGSTTTSVRGSGGLVGLVHDASSVDFSDGAFSEAWSHFEMDELEAADFSSEVLPSPEEQEVICNILFEHDDFIERLLNDDAALNSVLVGGASSSSEDTIEDDVEDLVAESPVVSSSPLPVAGWYPGYPGAQLEDEPVHQLLHDCMWSGQCTDDCKQKAAREKMSVSSLLSCSPFEELVMSPASAMTPRSPDDVLDMRIPLMSPAAKATETAPATVTPAAATSTSKTTSTVASSGCGASAVCDDALVAGQCVDPSSVLSYTPLSDHSYHQATSSAPPTPPDSPKAVSQQSSSTSSATSRGASNGSASVGQLTLYRSHNGSWQRGGGMVMSDTPSESDFDAAVLCTALHRFNKRVHVCVLVGRLAVLLGLRERAIEPTGVSPTIPKAAIVWSRRTRWRRRGRPTRALLPRCGGRAADDFRVVHTTPAFPSHQTPSGVLEW
ncbi:hypothetical protein HPB51_020967 [Rhipicephalus microplus]|uniref:Uncharacterized protein n=1 Tax=Rhipicephalus microplus TaxID=6941 RepID=A0A9J6EC43_RHIMP|nr:hypothetical protein HPB51_020967 [Rhipicephalus microplus]